MRDTVKILPCPFCGGEAEFVRKPVKANGGWCDAVYVRCTACDARSNRVLYSANIHRNDSEYTEAAETWNTRKPMERIVEQLEKAKTYSVSPQFSKGIDNAIEIIQKGGTE